MTNRRLTLVSALSSLDNTLAGGDGNLTPPLGVLTLASILRPGFEVSLVDLDHLWFQTGGLSHDFHDQTLDAISATAPDVLGFSSVSGSYPASIRLARACALRLPGVPIILGGPQASVVDVPTLEAFPFVDYIVRGEADRAFPELLSIICEGGRAGTLPGVTYRAGNRIIRNVAAPSISDLDDLPLPAFDLLPYTLNRRSLPIEAGRGCPFACTFCSTNDFFRRRFRLRSPGRMLDDMRALNAQYGATVFSLTHDMFTVDRRRVAEFCETMIAAGSPFQWSCSARTDCVDPDLLRLMRRAGCYDIFFGIETGSQRMQKVIDKNLDLQAARDIFLEADAAGLRTTASIITGYPEETPEDLCESIRFYGDVLRFPIVEPQLNILSPLAGTPITEKYKDELYLDEEWTSISESGCGQDAVDRLLIATHPEIFQSFYALPSQTPRSVLRRVRDFLYVGAARCAGLIYALHLQTADLFDVFQRWESAAGPQSAEWFYSPAFTRSLLAFADDTYGDQDPVVRTMSKFYRACLELGETARSYCLPNGNGLTLSDGVFLVECKGDVHAILRAFRDTGGRPQGNSAARPVTAVVRLLEGNRCEVLEFPFASLELLRHAQTGSTISEILADFEFRGVRVGEFTSAQVVHAGIEVLERKGLVRRPPVATAQDGALIAYGSSRLLA